MKEKSSIGILIIIAIAVLIGTILVSIIASNITPRTQLTYASRETVSLTSAKGLTSGGVNSSVIFTLTNAPTGWKAGDTDCYLANVIAVNGSDYVLTANTDYVLDSATGKIYFQNTKPLNQSTGNTTYITYDYCPDDYVAEGWGRTMLNLVPGFFVIAILLGSAFVIFWILKREGIDFSGFN